MLETLVFCVITPLICLSIVGYALRKRRAREQFVNYTRLLWRDAGRTIQWGPFAATYYGTRPKFVYRRRVDGAIGVVDGQVEFIGPSHDAIQIPAWQHSGFRLCGIINFERGVFRLERALEIHTHVQRHWDVHTFALDSPQALIDAYHRINRYISCDPSTHLHQLTPTRAVLMEKDKSGELRETVSVDFYLAPGRMILGWGSGIHYAHVRRITVLEYQRQKLLSIDYTDPDSDSLVDLHFLIRGAEQWADKLSAYTGIPVESHIGRKKKEHDGS